MDICVHKAVMHAMLRHARSSTECLSRSALVASCTASLVVASLARGQAHAIQRVHLMR